MSRAASKGGIATLAAAVWQGGPASPSMRRSVPGVYA
jgi:hypothetical protein